MDQNEWTSGEVNALLERLNALEKRIDSLEGKPPTPSDPTPTKPAIPPEPAKSPALPPPLPKPIPTPQDDARAALASAIEQTPAADRPVADIPAAPPRASLEQKIGQQWMLWAGAAIFLLGGIFFLKFAYDKGWIHPPLRCCVTMIAGIAIVVAGQIALRKKYRHYAACLFGIALAMLYYTSWAASPSGWYYPKWSMLSTTQSYLAMCAVTALGIGLAVQSRLLSTALIALVGAFLTPVLLSTNQGRQIALYNYILIVDVGFLLVALLVRPYEDKKTDLPVLLQSWGWVAVIAFAGTVILFLGGLARGTDAVALQYSGIFCGLFATAAYVAQTRERFIRPIPEALFLATSLCWIYIWRTCADWPAFLGALIASHIVAILALQKARWQTIRPTLWLVLMAMVSLQLLDASLFGADPTTAADRFAYWAMLGLWLVDVLNRCRRREAIHPANSILAAAITAFVILTTIQYYPDTQHGLYLTAMAALMFGVFGSLYRMESALFLRISYVLQGGALLFIAVPVQFDGIQTTLGWIGLGMIALFLIRRYALIQLVAAVYVGVLLAMLHFLLVAWRGDPDMLRTIFTCFGQSYSVAIAAAYGLAATGIVCMMSLPKLFKPANTLLGLAGLGMLAFVLCVELNFEQSTANLLAIIAMGITVLQCLPDLRRPMLDCILAVLIVVAFRWVVCDYLAVTVTDSGPVRWCLLNPTWISGMVLMGLISWLVGLVSSRDRSLCPNPAVLLWLGWAVAFLWSGSFEIHRAIFEGYITTDHQEKALQMGLSLYWGVMAMGLLVAGFARRLPPVRYVAIALFVLTVAKVLLVDMADVEAIYRIGTFLGLGALMLGGSLVYHRAFKQ